MIEPQALRVPRVNANDESAIVLRWLVAAGARVEVGDPVVEIETSKAAVELEADRDGFLLPVVEPGATVGVGDPLAWLADRPDAAPPPMSPRRTASDGDRLVSREALSLLQERGLSPADVPGDGPVRVRDVEALLAAREAGDGDWERIVAALPVPADATVVFGADVQGVVVADCLALASPGAAVVFVDDAPRRPVLAGLPVVPSAALAALRARGIGRAHIAFSAVAAKLRVAERLEGAGFEIVGVRHPTAVVAASATIGRGVFLGPLTIVGPEAVVEEFAQINNGAIVAHHARVGRAARLSDGVRLAGNVCVEPGAFLGLGVTVNEKIVIGAEATIVSGVSVFNHVPSHSTVRAEFGGRPRRRAQSFTT